MSNLPIITSIANFETQFKQVVENAGSEKVQGFNIYPGIVEHSLNTKTFLMSDDGSTGSSHDMYEKALNCIKTFSSTGKHMDFTIYIKTVNRAKGSILWLRLPNPDYVEGAIVANNNMGVAGLGFSGLNEAISFHQQLWELKRENEDLKNQQPESTASRIIDAILNAINPETVNGLITLISKSLKIPIPMPSATAGYQNNIQVNGLKNEEMSNEAAVVDNQTKMMSIANRIRNHFNSEEDFIKFMALVLVHLDEDKSGFIEYLKDMQDEI